MKFADPVDFSHRMVLWVARLVGAHVAGILRLPGVKKDLASLPVGSPAASVLNVLSGLSMRASEAASAAAAAAAAAECSEGAISASASLACTLVSAAASAELAATAAVDVTNAVRGSRDAHIEACHAAGHSFDSANALRMAGNDEPVNLFGSALLAAWTGAGGDVDTLHRPGINQLLVQRARECGLDMSDWHCGTAHCIAGWYSVLSDQPGLELAFSCWFAAALVFAVNNPGERLPYFGQSQAAGKRELERLADLNRVAAHAPV